MAKKEKKPKEKKVKEKKPPKEKKPKAKKPPKPKKEKAPKKKKAAGGEGGKKGGKKTLLLVIIVAVVVVAAGLTAFFTLRSIGGGDEDQTLEESENAESEGEEGEEGNEDEKGEEGEEGEESGESGEDTGEETPAPAASHDPLRITTAMTTSETLAYLRRFTPASLGLSGESMDDYEIYAADNVVLVDGYTCSELSVYSKDTSAGTNDIEGWFLLSRGSDHKLFRLDKETGELTELEPELETQQDTEQDADAG